MEIYKSERITVKVAANSAAKVVITDNFAGGSLTINREAFLEMCRELGKEERVEAAIAE